MENADLKKGRKNIKFKVGFEELPEKKLHELIDIYFVQSTKFNWQ